MANPKTRPIAHSIKKMGSNVKQSAWTSIMESLVTLILGILFVIWPDFMIKIVAYVIGVVLIAKGVFDLATYFSDKRNVYSNLLLSGIISTLIGIAALIAGPNIANVFRIIIGIFLIYEALTKLNSAIKLYYAKINLWRFVLSLALVILVLGIFVTFNDTAAVIGWTMVIAGLIGIISDIAFIQQVDKVVEILTESEAKTTHKK